MSAMKRFAEALSIEMGYGGAITDEVLREGVTILSDVGMTDRIATLLRLYRGPRIISDKAIGILAQEIPGK